MNARIVVSQYIFDEALEPLRQAGVDLHVRREDDPMPYDELRAMVADADALICLLTDRIDDELLQSSPHLGLVANVAVGFDNIAVDAATQAGAAITNTPGVLTDATADLAMALMLATARRIPEGDAFLRAGTYTHWKLAQEQLGLDVYGQNLGIYGFGQIGRAVAQRAAGGFDMTVRYHDAVRLSEEEERRLGVTWAELDDLLASSDVVSVHAPLTPETFHAIDADALERMKPNAILINTARGPIVDEGALADALSDGTIAGAGLDVYEDEPEVHPALLEQRHRVVLLPHLGSATDTTRREMADIAVGNVLDALDGKRPRTLVNGAAYDRPDGLRGAVGSAARG